MLAACPVHPKGIMVIPMLWRIHGYVVCVLGVKNQKHHTHPYRAHALLRRMHCPLIFRSHNMEWALYAGLFSFTSWPISAHDKSNPS